MAQLAVVYARVSTEEQDLTAQRDGLAARGCDPDRVYVDLGLTGRNRDRPGLREAAAACRAGDTLVVTELDRLARSLPDTRAIAEELSHARRQGRGAPAGPATQARHPQQPHLTSLLDTGEYSVGVHADPQQPTSLTPATPDSGTAMDSSATAPTYHGRHGGSSLLLTCRAGAGGDRHPRHDVLRFVSHSSDG